MYVKHHNNAYIEQELHDHYNTITMTIQFYTAYQYGRAVMVVVVW
jgi:hypothetical protein